LIDINEEIKTCVSLKNGKYHEKKLNLIQKHLHEINILQIHNARPEFEKKKKKKITAINQSESSILI
jgi:hypothetical protein